MFLKKLYRHSKPGFFFVIVFLLAFLVINYKWGVTATPVFQFGMYSTPFHITDTQEVYLVKVNDKIINCGELSFMDRDIIQLYPANYAKQERANLAVYLTMRKYLVMAVRAGLMNIEKFSNNIQYSTFAAWYKQQLEKILKERVDSFSLSLQHFTWQHNELQITGSPVKSNFIVP